MNHRTASAAAGVGYLVAVVAYAVLAGIAPEQVADPSPRIPSLLFSVIVPAAAAFTLGAGSVWCWRRFGLRAPVLGLLGGSLVAVAIAPDEGLAWVLLLGGFGWLTLLGVGELLGRALATHRAGDSLTPDERAGVVGVVVGLAYAVVFVVFAGLPYWRQATGPSALGPVEGALSVAFLAGAFCLLFGLPVALALRHRLVTPFVTPWLWLAHDVLSGWRNYTVYDEFAVLAFFLGWPLAMVALCLLALVERTVKRGWRRARGRPNSTVPLVDSAVFARLGR